MLSGTVVDIEMMNSMWRCILYDDLKEIYVKQLTEEVEDHICIDKTNTRQWNKRINEFMCEHGLTNNNKIK